MKKLVSLVLAVAMILSLTTFATAAETESSWAAKALETVYNLDIMRGDQNGDMHLTEYLTREEMFSLMYRLSEAVGVMDTATQARWNMYGNAAGNYLGDIGTVSFWAKPYAAYNWVNKIFTGDDKGNLNPKGNLSYYDCATLMLRALGYQNTLLLADGQWRLNVLRYGMEAGLFDYMSVTDLAAPITRLNIAVMVYNALQAGTVTCTTNAAGATSYTPTGYTLIEAKFGFESVDEEDILDAGLVTAYDYDDDEIQLNLTTWVDADAIGLTDDDLPALYGQVISWVARPGEDGKVLRAAEIYDLDWVEFSYRGTDSIKVEDEGYKADKKTEIAYTDDLCAYLRVTTGGKTYVIPNVGVLQSLDDSLYCTTYTHAVGETTVTDGLAYLINQTYYSTDTNTIRFTDAGNGVGFVFFDNQKLIVKVYDKDTDTYDSDDKTVTISGLGTFAVQSNYLAALTDGDVIFIDYEYLFYDSIPVIYSITKIEPTQVNGGLLTATYKEGHYGSVKLNGNAVGVSNTLTADSLVALYAMPTEKDDGDTLGYVYVLDGYIVAYKTGAYDVDTPATPTSDYTVYVTKAPTFTFNGALLLVTFEGNKDGVNGTYTVTLANAAMLGNDDPSISTDFETFTILEATAAFAPGKLVFVDFEGDTIDVTGQKVDTITDTDVEIGYVYRWIDLAYNNINKQVMAAELLAADNLGDYEINLALSANVYYGTPIADNITSTVVGNTIASLLATDTAASVTTMSKIAKSMYYTYVNGSGKTVYVFMANAAYDASERSLWSTGSATAPAGVNFMLLAEAPTLTVLSNGDVTATLNGYIDGVLIPYTIKVKAATGIVTTLYNTLKANEVVRLEFTASTGYTVCAPVEGDAFASGYVISYVNETWDNLNKKIKLSSSGLDIDITIGSDQTIVGSFAEERYNTLATEIVRYNASNDDVELKDIAKTAYVKYTANGKTFVVFTANSYNATKRTAFETWVAAHPAP